MRNLIVFHSADFDGQGSAFLVANYLGLNTCDFFGHNYEPKFNIRNIQLYDNIYIVDINNQQLVNLLYLQKNKDCVLTLIDHHLWDEKFLDKLRNSKNCRVIHDTSYSAIMLTWKYLYSNIMPEWVKLLGDYDRWYNDKVSYWNNLVLPFQMWCRANRTLMPENIEFWKNLYLDKFNVKNCIQQGKIVLDFDNIQKESTINSNGYMIDFEGFRTICCNTTMRGSQLFDSVYDEDLHELMLVYCYKPKSDNFVCSIYSTQPYVDCSKIAKKYGGGGHKGAAGFSVSKQEALKFFMGE